MSEVISFRLDRNNPREAQALGVLKKGQEAGYSLRHVLTEALLALEAAAEDEQAVMVTLADLTNRLAEIHTALENLRRLESSQVQPTVDTPIQATLAESFLLSVKNAAKPGIDWDSQ